MMKRAGIAAAALVLALPAMAQRDYSKVEIRTTRLGDTTYMMQGAGGNLGLSIGDDAVFLIDDQYAPLSEKIVAAIAKLTPKPVKFVVNTHWHSDHTGGNENFATAGAIVVAHENVRHRLSSDQFLEFFKITEKAAPRVALPVVTFAGSVTFHLNGDEIRVLHVPRAHTDGDAMVHFVRTDVLHTGDVFWNGLFPFIDTASGGTLDGTIAACDRALAIAKDSTRIIPGHGPLSDKAGLKAYRDMLAVVAERIGKLVAAGKTPEEVEAARPLDDLEEKWGKGSIKAGTFSRMVAHNILKNR
jgi:cyclase